MSERTDFYAVLGVPRDADGRTIKKAYFRLVRQYPPETHPEEFRRLREAYEVLSNQDSRRDYDNLTQYGDEIGGHLRAGMEAMDRGDLQQAQQEFQRVLALRPELHHARDLLGISYLNNNQAREALEQFNLLVAAEGGNATYHLHRGYAHYALDQHAEALAAYERARELDPTDTRILVAMADCYTAMDRHEEALGALDRAMEAHGAPGPQDHVLLLRKVQIQLLRERADLAEQEIDALCRALPADPEVRRQVAQKLSALAAQLFRLRRPADGNRLLRRAQQIAAGGDGRSAVPLSFPLRVVRHLSALPRATQDRLRDMAAQPCPYKLVHGVWAGPLVLAVLALAVLGGGLAEMLTARHLWQGNGLVCMAIVLAAGPALALLAAERILRVLRSPLGRFTTIHPLYLLQVDLDRITAWPLVNLHDVSMTHHLQNGMYQYTAVKADFAGMQLTLMIRGQQAAVEWAQALLDARHRCLGLLSMGMLHEEEGADLLPPEILHRPQLPLEPHRLGIRLVRHGLAAGAGLALALGGIAMNARAADEASWEAARAGAKAGGYRQYLARHPKGRHVAEARHRLDQIYEEAKARYERQAADAPGRQAMLEVLDALKAAPTHQVGVRYAASVDMSTARGQCFADGTLPIQPDRAFAESLNRQREVAITHSLASAFQRILPEDVLSLTPYPAAEQSPRPSRRGALARPRPAVIFDVSYRVTPSGEMYRSMTDRGALYGIQIAWTLRVRTPQTERDGRQPYTIELVSQPAGSIRYLRPSSSRMEDDEILPYIKMAESAFAEFGRQVARDFGVSLPPPRTPSVDARRPSLEARPLSPEARRVLQDLARSRKLSPTALEEMERLLRAHQQMEAAAGD